MLDWPCGDCRVLLIGVRWREGRSSVADSKIILDGISSRRWQKRLNRLWKAVTVLGHIIGSFDLSALEVPRYRRRWVNERQLLLEDTSESTVESLCIGLLSWCLSDHFAHVIDNIAEICLY